MDRRKFCVSSAAVAAGIVVGQVGAPAPVSPAVPALPGAIYKVIFDTRFPESRAFGAAAAGLGRVTAAIRGDVTALWFDDLRPQWALGRGAIAGMTTMPSFFCLEQLAKDHWMRARIIGHPLRDPLLTADPQLVSWVIA